MKNLLKELLSFHLFMLLAIPLSASSSNASFDQITLQADALWEAQDYGGVEALYQQLRNIPLQKWQQARLQYNLATLQLARHQTTQALVLLQKIVPNQLALPRFSRNLFINEGIAYLQYEQSLAPNTPYYDQQKLYVQQSVKSFEKAQGVGCQVQQMEQIEKDFACSPQHMIEGWITTALFELDAIQHKRAQQWMESASIEKLSTLLYVLLQQLISEANTFSKLNKSTQYSSEWTSYFARQAETFDPLWKVLKNKKFTAGQLASFNKATADFQQAMLTFGKNDLVSAITSLTQTLEKLKPLCYRENIDIFLAHLNFDVLLLQPSLAVGDIQSVQWEVEQLKASGENSQVIEQIKQNVQAGLESYQKGDLLSARFFLIAGFAQLDSILPIKNPTALSALQNAFDQANRAFNLFLLSQLIPQETLNGVKRAEILKDAQEGVSKRAKRFIQTVLKEQEELFQDPKNAGSVCLESPWDQAIPLFDHGYVAAQSSEKLLTTSSVNPQLIAAQQEQTLQNWQQTLNLLKNPPPQNQQNRAGGSSAAPKNFAETYRLIQEMYLEDQSNPQPVIGEVHSW